MLDNNNNNNNNNNNTQKGLILVYCYIAWPKCTHTDNESTAYSCWPYLWYMWQFSRVVNLWILHVSLKILVLEKKQ